MNFDTALMKSIESLGYEVTVGDVAANAGLEINQAQKGLLALAGETQGNLLVSDSGDIIYKFPKNFRSILNNRYWQLKVKQWLESVWKVIFYIIRISFGILLILSILLMTIAIIMILIYANSSQDDNNRSQRRSDRNGSFGGGNFIFLGNPFDSFWLFSSGYETRRETKAPKEMNFLESVFSFLFGDGNPNRDFEQKRWNLVGTLIKNQKGAVISEEIAPYLDIQNSSNENFMIPVLSRFNGYPEVSPNGEIIYYFPDLQVTANNQHKNQIKSYLEEENWKFSRATQGQIMLSVGLGSLNLVLLFILNSFLNGGAAGLGGLVGFVALLYPALAFYAIAFFAIPLIRYLVINERNKKVDERNLNRQNLAQFFQNNLKALESKLLYARQFAQEKLIKAEDITYSTEKDLLEQQIEQSDKIDEEWQKKLNKS